MTYRFVEVKIKIRMLAFLAGATVAALILSTAMVASAASGTPYDSPTFYHTRAIDKVYIGEFSGDWARCEYVYAERYTQNVICPSGTKNSLSVSGNKGYSYSDVSAGVGFNISYRSTLASGSSIVIKPGGHGWNDVGYRYRKYTIVMQRNSCGLHGGCTGWGDSIKYTVQEYLGDTYAYFGTGAK